VGATQAAVENRMGHWDYDGALRKLERLAALPSGADAPTFRFSLEPSDLTFSYSESTDIDEDGDDEGIRYYYKVDLDVMLRGSATFTITHGDAKLTITMSVAVVPGSQPFLCWVSKRNDPEQIDGEWEPRHGNNYKNKLKTGEELNFVAAASSDREGGDGWPLSYKGDKELTTKCGFPHPEEDPEAFLTPSKFIAGWICAWDAEAPDGKRAVVPAVDDDEDPLADIDELEDSLAEHVAKVLSNAIYLRINHEKETCEESVELSKPDDTTELKYANVVASLFNEYCGFRSSKALLDEDDYTMESAGTSSSAGKKRAREDDSEEEENEDS